MKKSTKRIIGTVIVAGAAAAAYYIYKHPEICNCSLTTNMDDEDDNKRIIKIDEEADDEEEPHKQIAKIEEAIQDNLNSDVEVDTESNDYPSIVQEISALYPYLSDEFIYETFNESSDLDNEYDEDDIVLLTHVSKFTDEDTKKKYMSIIQEHGYRVELDDEDASLVKASGYFEVKNSKVLSEIYNVANQTNCLDGEYIGYRTELA